MIDFSDGLCSVLRKTIFVSSVEEAPAEAEPKFSAFTGTGRRLDGKPLKQQPPPVSSSGSKDKAPAVSNGNNSRPSGSSSQTTARQAQGKLVFGSNANRPKETKQVLSIVALYSFCQIAYHYLSNDFLL